LDQVADALEEAAGGELGVGPQVGDRGHGGEQDQVVGGIVAPLPTDEPFTTSGSIAVPALATRHADSTNSADVGDAVLQPLSARIVEAG
jgi:hypothetical protein